MLDTGHCMLIMETAEKNCGRNLETFSRVLFDHYYSYTTEKVSFLFCFINTTILQSEAWWNNEREPTHFPICQKNFHLENLMERITHLCYQQSTYTILKVMLFINHYLSFIFVPNNMCFLLNISHLKWKKDLLKGLFTHRKKISYRSAKLLPRAR